MSHRRAPKHSEGPGGQEGRRHGYTQARGGAMEWKCKWTTMHASYEDPQKHKNFATYLPHEYPQTVVQTCQQWGDVAPTQQTDPRSSLSSNTCSSLTARERVRAWPTLQLRRRAPPHATVTPVLARTRTPSVSTDARQTDSVPVVAFASKAGPNIAWEQRFKPFCSFGFPPLSGKNILATDSDIPTACATWTQQVRAPDPPKERSPHRFQLATPGCAPPLSLLLKDNPTWHFLKVTNSVTYPPNIIYFRRLPNVNMRTEMCGPYVVTSLNWTPMFEPYSSGLQ